MTLHKFEGRDVIGTKIKLTNAGDGLSKAMAIDPVELRSGDTVYLVMEAVVGSITFDPIKDTEAFARVQQLKAGTATLVGKELVSEVLERQRTKIEEAEGVHRLQFPDGDDEGDADGSE